MTSMRTPARCSTRSMKASLFLAVRRPMVSTAAISAAPLRGAPATMPAIATTVRSMAPALISPVSARRSPSRVTSARSTIVRHMPSGPFSPTWNFTEFVPTSMTASRGMTAHSPRHADEPLQPTRVTHVLESTETEAAHDRDHSRRILGFDRDRSHVLAIGGDLGQFHRAFVDPIPSALLVDRDRPHLARLHQLLDQLLECVGGSR